MKVSRRCPMCGKTAEMEFTEAQVGQYEMYNMGFGYIQDVNATPTEREFLKTGYCEKCQSILFAPPEPQWVKFRENGEYEEAYEDYKIDCYYSDTTPLEFDAFVKALQNNEIENIEEREDGIYVYEEY